MSNNHSLLITHDQTITSFGLNDCGQLGLNNIGEQYFPAKIETLKHIKQVSCGRNHSLALTELGEVFTFGSPDDGQLGLGDIFENVLIPTKIESLSNIKQISCGNSHTLVLNNQGEVFTFGENHSGQLGLGHTEGQSVPVKIESLSGIKYVACGGNHSLVVHDSGEIFAFGGNRFGQLGIGNNINQLVPIKINYLMDIPIQSVICGFEHSMALTNQGNVYSFGNNVKGQLGKGTSFNNSFIPVKIDMLGNIKQLSSGNSHTMALSNEGFIYVFGDNKQGQLGTGDRKIRTVPIKLESVTSIVQVACGNAYSHVLTTDGIVLGFGDNEAKQLGPSYTIDQVIPIKIELYDQVTSLWK